MDTGRNELSEKYLIRLAPRGAGKRAFYAQGWVRVEVERERVLRARLTPCRADLLEGVKIMRREGKGNGEAESH